MDKCTEIFLDDVVAVSVVDASETSFGVPANIPNIKELSGSSIGTPLFSVGMDSSHAIQFDEAPTLNISSGRTSAGTIYTHELELNVVNGCDDLIDAISNLHGRDYHIIYTLADGSARLSYALPNTSNHEYTDKAGSDRSQTLKLSLKSMSAWIVLTNAS